MLSVRVSGEREDILNFVEQIRKSYITYGLSRLKPNDNTTTKFHVFVDLVEKEEKR